MSAFFFFYHASQTFSSFLLLFQITITYMAACFPLLYNMTNLGSILKSRDITLPTEAHIVRVTVFPVVLYGCEGWTTKKAERQRIDAFEL